MYFSRTATRIFLFLLSILPLSVRGMAFDYFENPVTALSDIGYPEETQVLSNATFRSYCGAFQILPEGIDPRTSYTLTLEDGRYPIVQFPMRCGAVDADVAAFAAAMPESHRVAYKASTVNLRGEFCIIKIPNLINFIRIRLRNPTTTPLTASIRLLYRPGEGIPMQVDYQSKEFIYYDWKNRSFGLEEDARLFGDGREILLASSERLSMGEGGMMFSAPLSPSETRDVFLFLPYFPMTARDARLLLDGKVWERYHKEKRRTWDERRARTLSISLPEKKPVQLFCASHFYLLETCLDQIGKWWILRANPFQYDQFYMRDGTYQVRALDLIGEHEMAERCLDFFMESRDKDGRFASQPTQYDTCGMALYAFGQHYLLMRNSLWAARVFPAVKNGVRWLEDYRRGGLMPPSSMNDNEQLKNAHIIGHNLWALTGLEAAVELAKGAGFPHEADRWRESVRSFRIILDKALTEASEKNGGALPPSLEGMDAEALAPGRFGMHYGFDWGNLTLYYPSRMFRENDIRLSNSLTCFRKWYREGLFPYPERGDEDQLHHYLSFDITQTSLARGDYNDVLSDLYTGYLLHTTACEAGCERFDRRTRDFIPPSNLTPHGTFAAKYIDLFRNFFVREYGTRLHLCSFLAPDWCAAGAKVAVERAPTNWGVMGFNLEFSQDGNGALLQIRGVPVRNGFEGYIVHLPPFLNLTGAVCDGMKLTISDNHTIFLPPGARHVEFRLRREAAPDVNYEKTVERYMRGFIKR